MKEVLTELFDYNHSMNQKLIAAFSEHSAQIPEKSVKWFSHILNAHQLWNNRVDKQEESYGVWQVHALGSLKDIDAKNHYRTLDILDNFDPAHSVSYVNTLGKPFANSVKDILFHVVNHSTYHRGQIASDFKENGITPLVTDFIAYKR